MDKLIIIIIVLIFIIITFANDVFWGFVLLIAFLFVVALLFFYGGLKDIGEYFNNNKN